MAKQRITASGPLTIVSKDCRSAWQDYVVIYTINGQTTETAVLHEYKQISAKNTKKLGCLYQDKTVMLAGCLRRSRCGSLTITNQIDTDFIIKTLFFLYVTFYFEIYNPFSEVMTKKIFYLTQYLWFEFKDPGVRNMKGLGDCRVVML